MIRTFAIIFISVFFVSCGFNPIYKNLQNVNFKIILNEMSGDRDINNLIKSNLKKYNKGKDKEFKIKLNTSLDKKIVAKDKTGKASNYNIKVIANFEVQTKNVIKIFTIEENFEYERKDNNFDNFEYERSIKENISKNISQRLISQLLRLK